MLRTMGNVQEKIFALLLQEHLQDGISVALETQAQGWAVLTEIFTEGQANPREAGKTE